jgi:hypothetical protein
VCLVLFLTVALESKKVNIIFNKING